MQCPGQTGLSALAVLLPLFSKLRYNSINVQFHVCHDYYFQAAAAADGREQEVLKAEGRVALVSRRRCLDVRFVRA